MSDEKRPTVKCRGGGSGMRLPRRYSSVGIRAAFCTKCLGRGPVGAREWRVQFRDEQALAGCVCAEGKGRVP